MAKVLNYTKATALVDAALAAKNNDGIINSLRHELRKARGFAKSQKSDEFGKFDTLLSKLPSFKFKRAKWRYMSWSSFQLWKFKTLHEAGFDDVPSKQLLEIFERVAEETEKKQLAKILK